VNALVLCNRPPDPLGTGDAKIAAHAIRVLIEGGYGVAVIRRSEVRPTTGLMHRLASIAAGGPLQMAITYSTAFHQAIETATASQTPDVIVAIHARTAQYVPHHLRARAFAVIIDAYGRNYASYGAAVHFPESILYRAERRRMARYEAMLAREFGAVGLVAPIDKRLLAREAPWRPKAVVHLPYAVDLAYFQPRRIVRTGHTRFLFTGRLNYLPNEDAAIQLMSAVWPLLRSTVPGAQLTIAGAGPSKALFRLAREQGVEIKADPPDLRDLMASSRAMIVPMRIGGGVQTKVLEAMATQLPVICTSFANSGLEAQHGEHLLLADDPPSIVRQAQWVIRRPADAQAMATRARSWVEAHHSHSNFAEPFISACNRLATTH